MFQPLNRISCRETAIYVTPSKGGEDAQKEAVPFMGVLGILVLINIVGVFVYCWFM